MALQGFQLRFSSQFCDVKNLPNCSTKLEKLVKITAVFSLKTFLKLECWQSCTRGFSQIGLVVPWGSRKY
jgi:hypothetical protein